MKRSAITSFAVGLLATGLLASNTAHAQVAGTPITFSDPDFDNWSLFEDSVPNPTINTDALQFGNQDGVGNTGNAPDGYLDLHASTGCAPPDNATGHWYDGTHQPNLQSFLDENNPNISWNPSAQGQVVALGFSVDLKMIVDPRTQNLNDGFNVQAYVEQNGYHYTAPMHFACLNHQGQSCRSWSTITGTFTSLPGSPQCSPNFEADGTDCTQGLGALKQPFVDGTPVSPDFSAKGAPMTFGIDFAVGGGQPCTEVNPDGTPNLAGAPRAYYETLVDNFKVTVTPAVFDETFDATSLSEPTFRIYSYAGSTYITPLGGNTAAPATSDPETFALPMGQYAFVTAGGRFDFTVGGDGHITYAPAQTATDYRSTVYDAKSESSTVTVHGYPFTVDATNLSEPFVELLGLPISEDYGFLDLSKPFTLTMIPGGGGGYTLFETGGGSFPFLVGDDGQLHFDPSDTPGYAFIDAAGTTLTVKGVTFGYQSNLSEPGVDLIGLHLSVAFAGTTKPGQLQMLNVLPGDFLFRGAGGSFVFTVGPTGAISYAYDPATGPDFRRIDAVNDILYIDGFPFTVSAPSSSSDGFDILGLAISESYAGTSGPDACTCVNVLPSFPGSYVVRDFGSDQFGGSFTINADDSATVIDTTAVVKPSADMCHPDAPSCAPTCASLKCGGTCSVDGNGVASCGCAAGFVLDADGKTCDDVNECTNGSNKCSSSGVCNNTVGSYTCACNAGFSGDGFTCTDIDECATGANKCSTSATCSNTPGSYACACKPGYTGDGFTCKDTTPPVVAITAPMGGANLAGQTGSAFIGMASDGGSGVATAFFTIDGNLTVAATMGANGVWQGAGGFSMSSLGYGAHSVTLTATDKAGNKATSAKVGFVVAAPPTVVFVTPLAGNQVAGAEDIVADGTGHGYDVAKLTITATTSSGSQTATCTPATPTSPMRCTWSQYNVANLCPAFLTIKVLGLGLSLSPPACALTLTAVVTDTAGQTGSATESVNVVPNATIIVGATVANKLSLTVTNLNLSFNRVQCTVNGAALPIAVTIGGTATMAELNPPAGPLLVVCTWTQPNGTAQTDAITLPNGIAVTGITPIVNVLATVH